MSKEIKLTRGLVAIVDDEDYEELNKYKWHISSSKSSKTCYAERFITIIHQNMKIKQKFKQKCIKMHRVIMNVSSKMQIDHIDGNGLNNQKSNLRICTNKQNMHNNSNLRNGKSGYKGVSYYRGKIRAQIQPDNKYIHLGYFNTLEEAARAYDEKAKELFGEFAYLNFPIKKGK